MVAIPEAVALPAAVLRWVTLLVLLGGGSELVLLGGAELGLVNELATEFDRLTVVGANGIWDSAAIEVDCCCC